MALLDEETARGYLEWFRLRYPEGPSLFTVTRSAPSSSEFSFSVVDENGEDHEAEVDTVVHPEEYTVVGVDVAADGAAVAVATVYGARGDVVRSYPIRAQSVFFDEGRSIPAEVIGDLSEAAFRREYFAAPLPPDEPAEVSAEARNLAEARFRGREFSLERPAWIDVDLFRSPFSERSILEGIGDGVSEAYSRPWPTWSPRLAELREAAQTYVGDATRVVEGPAARRAASELRSHGERLGRSYADQFRPYLPPTTLDTVALGVPSEVVDEFVALEAALAATADLAARREETLEK